ncbi:PASTA domain-containing protein [Geodermatophilus nigrescens]
MLRSATCLRISGLVLASALATGCGAEPIDMPDLAGLPLDEAHRQLEAMGFEEFEDIDAFEDRSILLDANWVVVASSPAAGEDVTPDDVVRFEVGQRDEERALAVIPADSQVAQEHAAELARVAAEEAAEQARRAAEEAQAHQEAVRLVTGYVNEVDPLIRLGNNVFSELDVMAEGVRSQLYGAGQSVVILSALEAVEALHTQLSDREPPHGSRRAGTHQDLVDATQRLLDGARTLMSAEGALRQSSLDRYAHIRVEAGTAWDAALTALYRDTGVTPPLLG